MAEPQQYCLKWNNYLRALTFALDNHRQQDHFVDVTLLCEGRKIKAHRVVLSSCSSYFEEILSECSHPHPFLIFNFIKFEDLNLIINFMYQGEISVQQEGLQSFLQVAKQLKVHGLNMDGEYNQFTPTNTSSTDTNNISENVAVPKSVRTTSSSATNTETQKNLHSMVETSTDATPSGSQVSCKKRKLADLDDNAATDRDDQTAGKADGVVTKIPNYPEYILGQGNIYKSTTDGSQEISHNLDYIEPDVSNIKTELDIFEELDTEESHTLVNDDEMTIESRRLTNPLTPHDQASLDLAPSCSNSTTTGNKDCVKLENFEIFIFWLENDKKPANVINWICANFKKSFNEMTILKKQINNFCAHIKQKWRKNRMRMDLFLEKESVWLSRSTVFKLRPVKVDQGRRYTNKIEPKF